MAETIGSLVDKITIVDLKVFHMREQVDRIDADQAHKEASQRKVAILEEQKRDLVQELSELATEVISGRKKLKVYRQFKMYNDPKYRSKNNDN